MSFGKISPAIMNRGITEALSDTEKTIFITVLDQMQNNEFPNLIKTVKEIVHGKTDIQTTLSPGESAALQNIKESTP